MVQAGRDIRFSTFYVTGPGLLDVSAGRNVYLADKGEISGGQAKEIFEIVLKTGRDPAEIADAEGLKLVASIAVGAKERVVVLEVNGEQMLLGVTAGGISKLDTLAEPLPPPTPMRVPDLKNLPNFAQLLQQRLRKDS